MRFATLFNPRVRSLALAGAFLATVALPLNASAHFGNFPTHRWSPDANPSFLPYASNCIAGMSSAGIDWQTAVDQAADNWSTAGTKVRYVKSSWPVVSGNCSSDPEYLATKVVLGGIPVASYLAWEDDYTKIACLTPDNCWFDFKTSMKIDAAVVTLNVWPGAFDSLSAFGMRAAVVHELGHSLGLKHAGYYAGEFPGWWFPPFPALVYSVMDFCCVFDRPQPHDIQDINALYN